MKGLLFIKRGIVITIITSVVLIPFTSRADKNNTDLYYQLGKIGIVIYKVKKFKITDRKGNNIIAERDKEIIKIKVLNNFDKNRAEKYTQEQVVLLNGLFEPQLPPYPEFLTKETGCNDKYKPVRKENRYGEYYLLYAGKRLGYGICTDDLIEYRASMGFYYCPKINSLFKIEYFVPKNEDINKLINLNESFNCNP